MKIHFVCTGNTYRSRLAMAYLNSKMIDNVEVSSSGVGAGKDISGPINWYAQRIIEKDGLVPFESTSWTQTTREILLKQDYIVFVQKWHHDQCVQRFGYKGKNFEIWDVEDMDNIPKPDSVTISKAEEIYQKITRNVDKLISRLNLVSGKI